MRYFRKPATSVFWSGLVVALLAGLAGCMAYDDVPFLKGEAPQAQKKKQAASDDALNPKCIDGLRSNCGDTQDVYLEALLRNLEIYGLDKAANIPTDAAPALGVLSKDKFGGVNWTKAVLEGTIRPRDTIGENELAPPFAPARTFKSRDEMIGRSVAGDEHFKKLIVLQVKNHLMADVLFPHGMHTYWVGCDSCHPVPFATTAGGTRMSFKEITQGKFCGKCHGKVAFPLGPMDNCRRCHVVAKKL